MKRIYYALSALLLLCAVVAGCNQAKSQQPAAAAAPPPPEVFFSLPLVKDVSDFEDFTGRTDASNSVDVRSQASGFLTKVNFIDGRIVKKGEVLFEIDSRIPKALLISAQATVDQNTVHVQRLTSDYQRAVTLRQKNAITQEEFDKFAGDLSEAEAALRVAVANRKQAEDTLNYTTITAEFTGRIGRRMIDPGNMVQAGVTPLTTIVALDPMYAYFDIDERTMLRIWELIRAKKITSLDHLNLPVQLGLSDEDGFPHQGYIDFIDNKVDPQTGTMKARGVFKNADEVLSPGLFARIRLPLGDPYQGVIVPEQALGSDQGRKYVLVIDDQNKIVKRFVEVGPVYKAGLRVVTPPLDIKPGVPAGVKAKERVVVSGLQRVRPGMEVTATLYQAEASSGGETPKSSTPPAKPASS